MSGRLAELAHRLRERVLDLIWDATLPVSSECPVCAFWRGVLAGAIAVWLTYWVGVLP
jgi:predicted hydrocarbon binding protein